MIKWQQAFLCIICIFFNTTSAFFMEINLNKTSIFCLKSILIMHFTLYHKEYFNSALLPNLHFIFRLWLHLDSTSAIQTSSHTTIAPQESTPYRDLTTTYSLTYKTDLTTTAIQQPSLANDRGTKYDLTSISPQTTETWSEIKTQVNEDETSYSFDWTQFDTSNLRSSFNDAGYITECNWFN